MEEQNPQDGSESQQNQQRQKRPEEMKKRPGMGERNPPTPRDVDRSERGE